MTETATEDTGTKLDPATGLPELPEGYWWEVGKSSGDWISSPRFEVSIKRTKVIETKTKPSETLFGKLFNLKTTVPGYSEVVTVEGGYVWDGDWIDADHLTPELILFTAKRVWKMFEEREERVEAEKQKKKITESLLGSYPPKSL